MTPVEIIGAAAAILTTASFFPQAMQVIRTRDTRAISLAMYVMFTSGVALWGIYGLLTMQWSIIIANAVTICLALTILAMKLKEVLARNTGAGPA